MFASIFTSLSSYNQNTQQDIVVWDVQTGVIITWIENLPPSLTIVFHRDQRTVTCLKVEHFATNGYTCYSTYDIFDGTQLSQGRIEKWNHGLGTHWAHENTLWSAMCSSTSHHSVINIYEFQPTSIPSLHVLSSFSIPHQKGELSFSPVSFHISFVTYRTVTILDVQDSKLLLQSDLFLSALLQGQFSPDGHFFMCKKSELEIGVWQNTPTGYMPWSNLRSRSNIWGISWSPASTSILCQGYNGIQLLCPSSGLGLLSLNKIKPIDGQQNHLVAYSVDQVHILMAQQSNSIITVLNHHLGTSKKLIDTEMKILDIKIVDNTVFTVDRHMLVSWDFEAGGAAHNTHGTRRILPKRVTSDEAWCYVLLSHDCSWIAAHNLSDVLVFNVKTWTACSIEIDGDISSIKFSPNGHQLWISCDGLYYFVELEAPENWNSLDREDQTILKPTEGDSELLFNHSSCGHSCGFDSKWVVDPQGRKILWLPPNWRFNTWEEARWDGNFLALLHGHHPEPIIVEFNL